MIAALKALHIAALAIWCAGLVALPVVMHVHGQRARLGTQAGFAQFRLVAHRSYTRIVTPAAVIAVAAGSALILALPLVDDWMLAKLVLVSGMVLVHAWLGHLITLSGERDPRRWRMPSPLIGLALGLPLMAGVLWLVLAKPDLAGLVEALPEAFRAPQGRSLPEPVAPI